MDDPQENKNKLNAIYLALGLACVALFQVGWYYNSDFQMAWMYEFSHYADIARSISHGQYHSHFLYPSELAVLEKSDYANPPWPITYRFPLFAAWIGMFFKIFGVSDAGVVIAGGAIWALLVSGTYLVGRSLFREDRWTALAGAVLVLCTPLFFRGFVQWGYADLLFAVLVLCHHRALLSAEPKRMVLVGLLGGLCYLSRPNFVLFLPILAVYIWLRKRDRYSVGYLAGFAVMAVGYRLTRPPVAAELQQTTILSGNLSQTSSRIPWLDYLPPEAIGDVLSRRFWPLMEKGFFNLCQELEWMTRPYGHYLYVPFALGAVYMILSRRKASDTVRDWVLLNLACVAVQVATFSFLRVEPGGRYWAWMLPVGLMLAAQGIKYTACGLDKRWSKLLIGAMVGLTIFWLVGQLRYFVMANKLPGWEQSPPQYVEFQRLAQLVPEDGWVVSNVGVHAAWYSNRASIDLPNSVADVQKMIERHPVKAVFIVNWPQGELYNRPEWQALTGKPKWEESLAAQLHAKSFEVVRGGVIFLF